MSESLTIYPFSKRESVAAAVATILVQPNTVDPESFDEVAGRFDIDSGDLAEAVSRLGIEEEEVNFPESTGEDSSPRTDVPDVLSERGSIRREYDGLRDPDGDDDGLRTTKLSFQSCLLIEATKRARKQVEQLLREEFGDAVETLRVSTSAANGTAAFPERILWVGVHYPVDVSDETPAAAVTDPPSFAFEQLASALPLTVDIDVDYEGETFHVHNLPVVPHREAHQF